MSRKYVPSKIYYLLFAITCLGLIGIYDAFFAAIRRLESRKTQFLKIYSCIFSLSITAAASAMLIDSPVFTFIKGTSA